ncbi:GNAT family N-acetyltransferase [Chloroflexota bacterium]
MRNANSEELDKVSRLLLTAFQQYENFIPSAAWQSYLENILDVRSRLAEAELIVAKLNTQLVGTVTLYLNISYSSVVVWPKNWAGIRLLAVDPRYRGQGVGRALMDECVRRCCDQGITTIGLHTTKIMDVARGMYEQMGFTRIPEFDFHPASGVLVTAYGLDI